MSNKTQTENLVTGSDLEALKIQATKLGISFHPNIKEEKLIDKINSHEASGESIQAAQMLSVSEITELQQLRAEKAEREAKQVIKPVENENQKRARIIREAGKLMRIRVSCMNPNKRDWEGEMYTVANRYVKFKKYVPFNNDEGWHVPKMMVDHLISRECQIFYTIKDGRGNKTRQGKLIKELNVEIMPDLTAEELQKLAQRQAMARGESNQ